MKCFVITDKKGKFVSAWPKIGIAKIHCRKELDDKIVEGRLMRAVKFHSTLNGYPCTHTNFTAWADAKPKPAKSAKPCCAANAKGGWVDGRGKCLRAGKRKRGAK